MNHPFVILNLILSSRTIPLSFGSSFCFPEPRSVILNEVKDLHAQFGVSCPVNKESKKRPVTT